MKTFLAVARREIVEKRFILWVALVAATQPFMVPIVRGLAGERARDVREATALILGLGMAAAVAAGLGSSLFAGELAARRMGFYFSRPISAFTLWAGKLAAAATFIAFVLAVFLGPAALLQGSRSLTVEFDVGPAAVAALLAWLFLVVHTISLIVRSRSALAFLDLVACVAVGLIVTTTGTRLMQHALVPETTLVWVAGGVMAISLLVASYRSVARGRTDGREAHRASSIVLWAIFGSAAVGFAAYAAWALAAPASALSEVWSASALTSKGWVAVEGRARGLTASFLYDTNSGRSQRYEGETLVTDPADRMAAWFVPETRQGPWTVHTLRLDDASARERETKLVLQSRWGWPLMLSADLARFAAVEGNLLNVYELETGRTLASFPVKERDDAIFGSFVSPDVVRMLRVRLVTGSEKRHAEILEADIASRRISITGTADDLSGWATVLTNPYRDEILVNEGRGLRITIRDPRTLAVRHVLREGGILQSTSPLFLANGKILIGMADESKAWLEVFTEERRPAHRIPLGAGQRVRLAGETSDGRILVSVTLKATRPGQSEHELYSVDVTDGTVRRLADRLSPTLRWWWWWEARRTEPSSEGTKLFLSDDHKLVRFDPATGERRVLLGGR